MEESIGYEALFSSDEWDSLDFGEWFDDLPPDDLSFASGVAMSGEGCAASSQAAPEAKYFFEEGEPDHCHGSAALRVEFVHEVSCRTRQLEDGTTEYVLECDICDEIGTAEDYEEADVIAQQHKRVTNEVWQVS